MLDEDTRGRDLVEGAGERERERQAIDSDAPLDQQNAKPLSPGEKSSLDQIGAGLQDRFGRNATSTPNVGNRLKQMGGAIGGKLSGNKKALGVAGGSVALIVLIIGGLVGLASEKLDSMMKNLYQKEFAKVEKTTRNRASKIVEQRLFDKAINKAIASDNPLLNQAYDNIPIDRIQSRLADRGFKIEGNPASGDVKITTPEGLSKTFSNEDDFNNFFASDARAATSRSLVESATEAETDYLEVYQRRFLRLLMRDEFDVKNWDIFDNKKGADAQTEVDNAMESAAVDPLQDSLSADVSCVLGGDSDCPSDENERKFPDGNTPGHATFESTEGEQTNKDPINNTDSTGCPTGSGAESCNADVTNQTSGANSVVEESATNEATGDAEKKLMGNLLEKIGDKACEICILNTLAAMDHAVYNNVVGKLIEVRREKQYVGVASKLLTIESKMHEGKGVSGDEVNAAMKLLEGDKKTGTPGIEGSKAFSAVIMNDGTKGAPIDPSKLFGGGKAGTADNISAYYKGHFGAVHDVLDAYRSTVGKIFDFLGNLTAKITAKIPGVSSLSGFLAKESGKLINYELGSVVSGTEVGTPVMNEADAGLSVLANSYARDSQGAPMISQVASNQMDTELAAAAAKENSAKPLNERLFALSNPMSLASRLAMVAPPTYVAAFSDMGDYVASLATDPIHYFGQLFSASFVNRAFAANSGALVDYGNPKYAYSDAQDNEPLSFPKDTSSAPNADGSVNNTPDGKLDQYDCPVVTDAHQENHCVGDLAVLNSMGSTSTSADDGGLGTASVSSTGTVGSTGTAVNGKGDGQALAQQLLADTNYAPVAPGVDADLQAVASGHTITNSDTCGHTVTIDPTLLQVMLVATKKYRIEPINIITGHGCDAYLHPQGRATDIDFATDLATGQRTNFTPGSSGDNPAVDRAFVIYIASLFPQPQGGGLGQSECSGRSGAPMPANVEFFSDSCNHQHIDMRNP